MHNAILSPSDDQFVASPQAAITEPGTRRFCNFHETPKKD